MLSNNKVFLCNIYRLNIFKTIEKMKKYIEKFKNYTYSVLVVLRFILDIKIKNFIVPNF